MASWVSFCKKKPPSRVAINSFEGPIRLDQVRVGLHAGAVPAVQPVAAAQVVSVTELSAATVATGPVVTPKAAAVAVNVEAVPVAAHVPVTFPGSAKAASSPAVLAAAQEFAAASAAAWAVLIAALPC